MTVVRRRPASAERQPAKRVPKKKSVDMELVVDLFRRQRACKRAEAHNKEYGESLRDQLMPMVEEFGVPHGEKGQHLAIELPEPVDGMKFLVRRRNASPFIDVDRTEKLAEERGFLTDIQDGIVRFEMTSDPETAKKIAALLRKALPPEAKLLVQEESRFSQERLMAFHQKNRDKLSEAELDALFDEDVRFSFNPEKP